MTENELLTKTGDELSRALGEVLQPETRVHGYAGKDSEYRCVKCDALVWSTDINYEAPDCTVADPICIKDWNVAMKWREWAVEKFGWELYGEYLLEAYYNDNPDQIDINVSRCLSKALAHAQPEHYLKAAASCEYHSWPVLWHDGEPCKHRGCQAHVSHPCEECGRTAAQGEIRSKSND